jgi:hypothetical protein
MFDQQIVSFADVIAVRGTEKGLRSVARWRILARRSGARKTRSRPAQKPRAFDQTVQRLHQLARYEQPVEIRVVVHALTVPRLKHLSEYIYRNLPFAAHVMFMGLELAGFTRPNLNQLWIDPYDQNELSAAVEYLAVWGMNVSIYNHQLYVLPQSLWRFARRSISDWKNIYLEPCQRCGARESPASG